MDDQRLEDYFDKDANEVSRKAIRQEIDELPASDEERIALEVGEAVRQQDEVDALRSRMSRLFPGKKKPNWYLIAASISVILASYLIFFNRQPFEKKLYEEYFQPYPGIYNLRSDTDLDLNTKITLLYQDDQFDEIIDTLTRIDNLSDTLQFYLAHSYLNLGNTSEAESQFRKISETSSFHTGSQWYVSLIHLANGEPDSCRAILKKYKDIPSVYQTQMKELYEKLDNL